MIESDIMRNITDQMSEGHPAGCKCDRCTQCRESNCADSTDECAETEQQPGATRRTKGRSPRVLVNCAMLLVVIGLSGLVGRAAETRSATIEIGNVGQFHIGAVLTGESIHSDSIIAEREAIDGIQLIAIGQKIIGAKDINSIDAAIDEVNNSQRNSVEPRLAIELIKIDQVKITPLNDYINPTIHG